MNGHSLRVGVAFGAAGAAVALLRPCPDDLAEFAAMVARPAVLPFAWHALEEANRRGDPVEAYARAQQLMLLLPQWTDGHAAFAYRYALADDDGSTTDERSRAARARTRLELAIAWMASARERAGRHELGLLQALAFLPEVAVRHEPALAALLQPQGGPAAMADPWLELAERRFPTAAVREQRTFYAPNIAAGLLAAGAKPGAVMVLATAITRSDDVRDRDLAAAWRNRLGEVVRRLEGDNTVDLTAVFADPRFASLHPFLR